jgi:acyl-CoA thioester hydrolase
MSSELVQDAPIKERGRGRHRFPVRVYFEDTDAGGVVYYANYLKFADRARTEMMREAGAAHSAMIEERGLTLVVSRCEADYMAAARLDDLLEVESRITGFGGATVDAEQIIRRDGSDLVRIRVRLACVNRAGRPARLPNDLRELFKDRLLAQPQVSGSWTE